VNDDRYKNEILTKENKAFARVAASRSLVLLKNNDHILPLKKSGKIAVVGPLADNKTDMLGCWAFMAPEEQICPVLEGITKSVGNGASVAYAKGANVTDDPYLADHIRSFFVMPGAKKAPVETRTPDDFLKEAIETAQKSDVVIAVLGETSNMSGEASSRSEIGIPESQENLLKALVATGKPVVLVLINGRPLTLSWENDHVPAIIEAWAPGIEAGNAIADVLFGDYNPSGKLTMTFPRSVGQIPIYYNHKNTGRPFDPKSKFTSKYLDIPNEPLFPFGYGLSYTTFSYSEISLSKTKLQGNESLTASVTVTNTGKVMGEEVVQLYISDPVASVSRSVKELKGFEKIKLNPDESKEVKFSISPEELKFYNSELVYDWEPGEFIIQIGTNSSELKKATCEWAK
jgi:beta-glucosidase